MKHINRYLGIDKSAHNGCLRFCHSRRNRCNISTDKEKLLGGFCLCVYVLSGFLRLTVVFVCLPVVSGNVIELLLRSKPRSKIVIPPRLANPKCQLIQQSSFILNLS